ncbi:phage tail spike protein [Clostridium saccharoperbutylacetonicum]|uniref:phage tail spike protein n=1 Tax=Clostridium saccharoperbutylacetonicum TaxID=36745 RepID=UPI0039EC9FBD
MIKLFDSKETNFTHCKWVLSEALSCFITETVDGLFDLDLVYPLEDGKSLSQYLVNGNIIKAPISETDTRGPQLFTIRHRSPNTKSKIVTIYAQAIARRELDLNMVLGLEVPAGKTRKEACQMLLDKCVESHRYHIGSLDTNPNTSINLGLDENTGGIINYLDISGISPRKAFLSDSENSIFKAYGGELIYNNFEINMVDKRGSDHSFLIKSGKNLEELQQDFDDLDNENFATAILPCSSDGVFLPNSEIIYSPNTSTLGKRFKKVVFDDVSLVDDSQEALNIVYDQLRERVQKLFNNGLDKIKVSNTINFVQLSNTEEYKDFKNVEKCEIGNNVAVKYYRRDDENQTPYLESVGRVTEIKFNVLRNRIEEVKIGDGNSTNIVNIINSATTTANTANTKGNQNKAEIKKVKKKTSDLQVVMEKRDNEIELSVTNLRTNTQSSINIMENKIESKVSKGDFGSMIEQNFDSIVETINDGTEHKCIFNKDGLTVRSGGYKIVDEHGNIVMKFDSDGVANLGAVSIQDLFVSNKSSSSGLYNTFTNMPSVFFPEIHTYKLRINDTDFYITDGDSSYDLKEYVKAVINGDI